MFNKSYHRKLNRKLYFNKKPKTKTKEKKQQKRTKQASKNQQNIFIIMFNHLESLVIIFLVRMRKIISSSVKLFFFVYNQRT